METQEKNPKQKNKDKPTKDQPNPVPANNQGPNPVVQSIQLLERPGTPDFEDGEYIPEGSNQLVPQEDYYPPRLFVIRNDNTGKISFGKKKF